MNNTSRRRLGFLLGALAGLAYSLVSYYVNVLYLPGLPLQAPSTGRFMAVILTTLAAGGLGLLAAWPEDALPGVLASIVLGTLGLSLLTVWNVISSSQSAFGTLVMLVITFLPRTFLLLPFALLVRWSLNLWSAELQNPNFSPVKLGLNLLLIALLLAALGSFSLYSTFGRTALTTTHLLVEQGMQAGAPEALPSELKLVEGFVQGARGAYTLELTDNPDDLPIQRAMTGFNEEVYGVFVRFENGYRFGCVFTPGARAECRTY